MVREVCTTQKNWKGSGVLTTFFKLRGRVKRAFGGLMVSRDLVKRLTTWVRMVTYEHPGLLVTYRSMSKRLTLFRAGWHGSTRYLCCSPSGEIL